MPNGILGWLLIGLVAGALGKLIMPGRDPGGIIVTIVISHQCWGSKYATAPGRPMRPQPQAQ